MLTEDQIREFVEQVVRSEGLTLFDLDMPSAGGSDVLRIFISGPDGKGAGITVDDCARVNRRILNAFEFEFNPPIDLEIEVSSPGVNRRLRTVQHFEAAKGERVRLKVIEAEHKKKVVRGVIVNVETNAEQAQLELDDEQTKGITTIPFDRIAEARVDFRF